MTENILKLIELYKINELSKSLFYTFIKNIHISIENKS